MVGIDSEWRPPLGKFEQTRPGILQISSVTTVYLIDLVTLANSKDLDKILTAIFTHPNTLSIAFSFESDLTVFKRCFVDMNFYKNFSNFIDLQDYSQKVQGTETATSLSKLIKSLFGNQMCKEE